MKNWETKSKENKKGAGWGGAAVVAFILLMNLAERGGVSIFGTIVAFGIAGALIGILVGQIKKAGKNNTDSNTKAGRSSESYKEALNRINDQLRSVEKSEAEEPVYVPKAAAKAVYDENISELNSERDRQRRISQLNVFMKNGIIDKEEYKVLMSRYERNSRQSAR